jgi:hypothetical protein
MKSSQRIRAGIMGAAAIFFVLAACAPLAIAKEGDGRTVSLRWAVGALDAAGGKPAAIQHDTRLGTGTKLKLLIEPTSPGSVYLLLLDSGQELHVLYRKSSTVAKVGDGKPTYIPPGSQWFELETGAGMETFFLLASVTPLKELEQLIGRYEAADAAGKKTISASIQDEIRWLNKANRNFARPVERPVMIGGQTRGNTDAASAIDQLAVEVEAERFYGKTITIDH